MGTIPETGLQDLERMFRINFNTAYTLTRELIPRMEKSGGGQILYIGSAPAIHPELAGSMLAYTLSKTLLMDLSKIINSNYHSAGISSTVIVPGTIDTPRNREAMPDADFSKWQTPGQIAGRIFELFTPEGASVRGGILEI
jgi:NAD(P)-dependent dehydrogenase (short-subunit alcohol dehydrogenase family)